MTQIPKWPHHSRLIERKMGDKCERAKKRHRLWLLIWFTICLNFGQSALTDPAIQEVNVQRKNGKSNKLFFSLLKSSISGKPLLNSIFGIIHFNSSKVDCQRE